MKTTRKHHVLAALIALTLLPSLTGCDIFGKSNEEDNILTGEEQPMGGGTVRTFIQVDDADRPVTYGIVLSEKALTGLSTSGDHTSHHNALSLDFPELSGKSPFDHAFVNWNPAGHEPPGIYDTPHFDFHFYMASDADRSAILPSDPDFQAKAHNLPVAPYIPAGYVTPPPVAGVPLMGVHWVDPASPELNGQPFTSTFLYGSWDGHFTFLEPMITKAFIESVKTTPKKRVTFEIPQPQAFETPGYYPTQYSISYNPRDKEYLITLENLVLH